MIETEIETLHKVRDREQEGSPCLPPPPPLTSLFFSSSSIFLSSFKKQRIRTTYNAEQHAHNAAAQTEGMPAMVQREGREEEWPLSGIEGINEEKKGMVGNTHTTKAGMPQLLPQIEYMCCLLRNQSCHPNGMRHTGRSTERDRGEDERHVQGRCCSHHKANKENEGIATRQQAT